ncbi:MAG: phenylacetate--CoA ligase family protein [Suipraeoptans sp.]
MDGLINEQKRLGLKLARLAYDKSPFYREYLSESNGPIDTFENLPFTDGKMLSENANTMLTVSLGDIARIRSYETSGSTSLPKRVFFNEQTLTDTISFFASGMETIVADDLRPTIIMFSDNKPYSMGNLLKQGLKQINHTGIVYGRPCDEADMIRRASICATLVGFPSDLYYLCKKAPHLRPGSVLLTADYIPSSIISTIEENWKCNIFTHYGMTETCYGLAVSCPFNCGMHIRSDRYYIEVIDPVTLKLLPFGVEGELVITSLKDDALPLIRYRTSDIGSISYADCKCHNKSPRILKVLGRVENISNEINIHALDDLLYSEPGVFAYEASLDDSVLTLVINGTLLDENTLVSKINAKVKLHYSEVPPWHTSGKRSL